MLSRPMPLIRIPEPFDHPDWLFELKHDGFRALAYTEAGHGTPLLCLHSGMGVDGAALRVPGIVGLADRGVRVIVPDQRGHGDSDHSDPVLYSHDMWVSDARAFALRLGLARLALLGHSYGGFLGSQTTCRG